MTTTSFTTRCYNTQVTPMRSENRFDINSEIPTGNVYMRPFSLIRHNANQNMDKDDNYCENYETYFWRQ